MSVPYFLIGKPRQTECGSVDGACSCKVDVAFYVSADRVDRALILRTHLLQSTRKQSDLQSLHQSTPFSYNSATMASVASKRLFQEYKHLTTDPPDGITAGPVNEDDLFIWEALIQGPEGTPYEGGIFPAELKFPKDYPLMPPTMRFLGPVWHPNG